MEKKQLRKFRFTTKENTYVFYNTMKLNFPDLFLVSPMETAKLEGTSRVDQEWSVAAHGSEDRIRQFESTLETISK